jgi:broad specificity phosphatase PhoE
MLRLIFVRHGRTPWNVQGRVQGGGGLDEVGRAQAARLGAALAAEPLAAVYASPALRARQTGRAVARLHGLPVRQRRLLADLDYGRYAGALLADVQREQPELFAAWRAAPHTVQFEGGERLGDLRERVRRFIAQAYANHDGATVLAATHDSPVRVAASLALGLGDERHTDPDLRTPLASVTELLVEGPHLRLARHKDVAHLAGIDDGFER